jgi:hypothetical protein
MQKAKLKTISLGRGGLLTVILAVITFLGAARSSATLPVSCWDAASEFNDSKNRDAANPSGVWSYGWKKNLTGRFFLATTPFNDPPSRFGWCSASGGPAIVRNVRPVTATVGVNPLALRAGALDLAPGLRGEYAVVRFTAPTEGTYKVSGQFYAQDDNDIGTTTDVWILPNDNKTGAFSGKIDYPKGAPVASFTSVQFQLKKGDTLDFEVGYGANKDYFYDNTGLNALIEKIK